ncbi:AzlD family protein [Denitrobaculum tricleocarpae]|uniref:AzlD family protein n=1 Tax=Denitrobaculum tricleocarpae TaxID=2591009 RepID=A0A545TRA9_9PROT|nr:AzlD domain-containing protein [Denitrobaculum tricleocarpae]TQV79765.1 AzlD family protein [Denitrobaculum tricleocarpae]
MHETVLIILACAAVTYLTRIGGHLVLSRFGEIHYRAKAALASVPTAVLTALVAPYVFTNGSSEALAILVAGLMALRASLMMSVAAGMLVLVALRALLI